MLVLSFNILLAQDYSKWNVSLSLTSSLNGILIGPAANRDIGNKFEIGVMPIFLYYKNEYGNGRYFKRITSGLNFSGKYYFSKETIMDPYVSSLVGYGITDYESNNTSSNSDYFSFVVLLGNEIQLGQKGWNFDFNIGLISIEELDFSSSFVVFPIYSIGIKKRFLNKTN